MLFLAMENQGFLLQDKTLSDRLPMIAPEINPADKGTEQLK